MWGGISALAVATGPSLGSVLIDAGGWRWAFFVNLPIALVAGLASPPGGAGVDHRRTGPRPRRRRACSRAPSPRSRSAITQGGDWGWSSGRVVGLVRRSPPCSAPLAVRRSARHQAPAIDLEVFGSRTVALANAGDARSTPSASSGCCWPTCCSSPSVWHYSTLAGRPGHHARAALVAALERSERPARGPRSATARCSSPAA